MIIIYNYKLRSFNQLFVFHLLYYLIIIFRPGFNMIIAFFRRTLLFDLSILFFFNQLVSFHSRLGSLIESKIVTFGFPGGKQCQVILYCWCDHCKHLFHQTLLKHQRKIEDISGNQGPSHQMAFRRNISCDGIRDCTRGLRWWHSYGKDLHPAACSAKCFPMWSLQANISVFIVSDSTKIKPCQSFVQCIVRLWVNTFNDTESSSTYSCIKRCKRMNMNPQQRGSFFCLDSNSNLFLSHHLSLSLCWSLLLQSHY